MNQPLLSIGMIFRNDIRSIERCLQALEPLRQAIPCELVMADTGSDDGSREVAERYADLVFDFPWVDDFSAARNAVMDRCSGVWYFTVDTDEYLGPDISQLVDFVSYCGQRREIAACVVQRNYRTQEMLPGDSNDFLALRLIRLDAEIRYQGVVHEAWATDRTVYSASLGGVVLHHDGYAKDDEARLREKMDRDLVLLRRELDKNPEDMRRLMQCQDASIYHPQERMGYLMRGMELVRRVTVGLERNQYCVVLYRNAVCEALLGRLPQGEEWLDWGEQKFSGSIFFRVDVCAAAAAYYYEKRDYTTALTWLERYHQGLEDYRAGRYEVRELTVTALLSEMPTIAAFFSLAQCDCLIHLERREEAVNVLKSLDLTHLCRKEDLVQRCLWLLMRVSQQQGVEEMSAQLLEKVWQMEGKEGERLRQYCLGVANQQLSRRRQDEGWRIFCHAPEDLGHSVKVVQEKQPQAITAALAQIEKWDQIPVQVLAHAVEHCAPFPPSFYTQGEEFLRNVAAALGTDPVVREQLPLWAVCDPDPTALVHRQFLFQCAAAALRGTDWEEEEGKGLVELWLQQADGYLSALYHPQVMAREGLWTALPGLHRCALHTLYALRVGEQGDEVGYVRGLRAALEDAPAMKGAVEYLLAHPPKTEAQRQLEQLAQQVRTVLAQYAPDDPAVEALKASPAYQRVSHLLLQ